MLINKSTLDPVSGEKSRFNQAKIEISHRNGVEYPPKVTQAESGFSTFNQRMNDMNEDKVYSTPRDSIAAFEFDGQVADVFENMISRSVPGYPLLLDLLEVLTERFAQPNTNCYDLGCSLGASTLRIRQHLPQSCHIIGVDTSPSMVERCKNNMMRDRSSATVDIRLASLQETKIENASIVALNYTLQFVPDDERIKILTHIAEGLVPGGILILSEKIRFEDELVQATNTELHHAFKKHQGYSDLEIAQKRASLENVLIPNTIEQHTERLSAAGFSSADMFLKCINFISLVAIK
jgi:tRNA (cmo5U34)-methyltransferase